MSLRNLSLAIIPQCHAVFFLAPSLAIGLLIIVTIILIIIHNPINEVVLFLVRVEGDNIA
jgi:hypothetical protein